MTTVGVIGLGEMGGLMAKALAERGRDVNVFDIRADVVEAFGAMDRFVACGSAREVGEKSDVVISSVYSPSDVEDALLDPEHGVLAGQSPGATTIDTTTNSVECARRAEAEYDARGVSFLAAPVSGRAPNMTMMFGGDRAAFDRVQPVVEDISARRYFLGTVTSATVAKHINQYLTYANFYVACEAVVIAGKAGVPFQELAGVLQGGSGNSVLLPFALGEVADVDHLSPASLRLVAKDVRMTLENAESFGVGSDLFRLVNQAYAEAETTLGAEPFPVFLRAVADRYGVDLPYREK